MIRAAEMYPHLEFGGGWVMATACGDDGMVVDLWI